MQTYIKLVIDLVESIEDYEELASLKQILSKSTKSIKLFKLKYLDSDGIYHVLRIELNLKKNKISYGMWNETVLFTKKIAS